MKKRILFAVLIIAIIAVSVFVFYKQEVTQEKLVKDSFENYRVALLNKDGEKAAQYVSSSTLDYYNDMLVLTKKGSKASIKDLRLADQITILMMRHLFTPATIISIPDGKGLIKLAVENELIGKNDVVNTEIKTVTILDNTASTIISVGDKLGRGFIFSKEQGMWKIDLISLLPQTDVVLRGLVPKLGFTSEEEFIFSMLESISGRKPSTQIWQPLI